MDKLTILFQSKRIIRLRVNCSANFTLVRVVSETKKRLIITVNEIEDIAYHLGLKNTTRFTRLFKK
ncbi:MULTISPECIES: hypothetical protein [unclassified Flavobacterium]|uniref:hypothetical protein n=1 Tax=unclassified Flavobacterium TaxID=196869 RepID=UPI0010522F34|nr:MULTISPECIES: hypothetical protein [unclassified Flavobacterium]